MGSSNHQPHAVNGQYPNPYSQPEPLSHFGFRPSEHAQSLPPLSRPEPDPDMHSVYSHQQRTSSTGAHNDHQPPSAALPPYPQTSQPSDRVSSMYSMAPSPYQSHPYPASTLPPSSVSTSLQQSLAPTAAGPIMPPSLRPVHDHGALVQHHSPYASMHATPLDADDPPTHVVGSQGRRGILPSAPGRPPAVLVTAGGTKMSVIPQKDEDGKFPCPHCSKTYLHAKHLKRHLLRHTGDRPYMCVLCRDTFSRSDILKRHFQKCCIRRGNPQGVSHLSHPQAHVKKSAAAAAAAAAQPQHTPSPKPTVTMGGEGDLSHMNGLGGLQGDGMSHFGFPVSEGIGGLQPGQPQISRANNVTKFEAGGAQDRGIGSQGRADGFAASYNSDLNQMGSYGVPAGQNGMMYAESGPAPPSTMEWPFLPVPESAIAIKPDPERNQTRA